MREFIQPSLRCGSAHILAADPLISVVTVVCDWQVEVERQLAAVGQEARDGGAECIIVMDTAGRFHAPVFSHTYENVDIRIVHNYARVGRSMSRTRGWRAARGRYIVFLEPDMFPAPGWLGAYRRAILNGPDLVLGTICCLPQGLPTPVLSSEIGGHRMSCRPPAIRQGISSGNPVSLLWYGFTGFNVLFSRDVLAASGGFPPLLSRADDCEVGLRLSELRPSVLSAQDAVVYSCSGPPRLRWSEVEARALLWRNPLHAVALVNEWAQSYGPAAAGREASGATQARPALRPSPPLRNSQSGPSSQELPLGTFAYQMDELVSHLAELVGVEAYIVHAYVKDVVARGLLTKSCNGRTYFDLSHTLNRLRARTLFLEAELKNASFARTHLPPRPKPGVRPVRVHCRGEYSLELQASAARRLEGAAVTVALPVEHRFQTNVRLAGVTPTSLERYIDREQGVIADVPVELCLSHDSRLSYTFECDIAEGTGADQHHACAQDDCGPTCPFSRRYLRVTYPQSSLPRVRSLIEYILGGSRSNARDDVLRLYRWIVCNLGYSQTRLSDYAILQTGIGNCIELTRLFTNMVRLLGVPAREQCGALMSRGMTDKEVLTVTHGYSPFAHTWAEIYLDGCGWLPVDLIVMCYGKWRANRFNVGPTLRRELVKESGRLLEYYFGTVDPYRIYASSSINRRPSLMMSSAGELGRTAEQVVPHLRHRLRCYLS